MKKLTIATLTALTLASGAASAGGLFTGVTLGLGYASDKGDKNADHNIGDQKFTGYSVFGQAAIAKTYLFTDFRASKTTDDITSVRKDAKGNAVVSTTSVDLNRYQASLGLGLPLKFTSSLVIRPFVMAGWSWDKVSATGYSAKDNSLIGTAGVKAEFGKHFITGVSYSRETDGFEINQLLVDIGFRF